jgi:cholesterol oxidase
MSSATTAPGISFRETMEGWFALNEKDPRNGQRKGKELGTWLTIRPTVTIDDLDRFLFDEKHKGKLQSTISFPPLLGTERPSGDGFFDLFAPVGNTGLKLMTYEFAFTYRKESYYLAGRKEVDDHPIIYLWKETTTLFTTLHKGADQEGPIVGAGILRISLPGFVRQLASMRTTNARSATDKMEAYLTFGNFFMGQLWDSYIKRH